MRKSIVLLLALFFSSFIFSQKEIYNNLFRKAITDKNLKDAEYCLKKGADINALDSTGISPLHYAANKGNIEFAKWLLLHDANVDNLDPYNRTPIMYAVFGGRYKMCHFLIENGAKIKHKDSDGKNSIDYSKEWGFNRIGRLLNNEEKSIKPAFDAYIESYNTEFSNKKYFETICKLDTCILSVINECDTSKQQIRDLINRLYLNRKYVLNNYLNDLITENTSDTISKLINMNPDLNHRNKFGDNFLILAASAGKLENVKLLIEKGISVNLQNNSGKSALMYAAINGDLRMCYELHSHGAYLELKDTLNKTAYNYALEKGYKRVAQFLKEPQTYSEDTTALEYIIKFGEYTQIGNIKEAVKFIEQGLKHYESEIDIKKSEVFFSSYVVLLISASNALIMPNDLVQSKTYIDKAFNLLESKLFDIDSLTISKAKLVRGNLMVKTSNYEVAITDYLSVKNYLEFHNLKSDPLYVGSINSLALAYMNIGEYKIAGTYFNLLIPFLEDEEFVKQNNVEFPRMLNNLSLYYTKLGLYNKALEFSLRSLDLLMQIPLISFWEPELLNNIGYIYGLIGDYENELSTLNRSLKLSESYYGINSKQYATTLTNIGSHYFRSGDNDRAESCFYAAIESYNNFGFLNTSEYLLTLENLASIYIQKGNFLKADSILKTNDNAFNNIKMLDAADLFIVHINNKFLLNLNTRQRFKNDTEVNNLLNKIKNNIGENNVYYAIILVNIGVFYIENANYQKAKTFCLKAISILQSLNSNETVDLATGYNLLGICYDREGNYDEAINYLLKSKKIFQSIYGEDSPKIITVLNNIAVTYSNQNLFDLAEIYYDKSLQLQALNYGDKTAMFANIELNFANFHADRNNFIKADSLYRNAICLNKELRGIDNNEYAESMYYYGKFNYKLGQMDTAYFYLNRSIESISKEIMYAFNNTSEVDRNILWDEKKSVFEDVINSFVFDYYPINNTVSNRGFDNALFVKGLLLNTSLQIQNAVLQSGDTALINTWENLRGLKRQISVLERNPLIYQGDISTFEAQVDSLDKVLTQKSQLYKQSQSDLQVKWTDVQKNLKPDEAAIEFISFDYYNKHFTDSTMYCALVLKKASKYPEMIPLFEEKQLDSLFVKTSSDVNNLYKRVVNLRKDTVEQTLYYGSKLYRLLWKPLEASLKDVKTVYYAPSGKLHQVAFAAIPVDSALLLSDKYNLHQLTSTRQVINEQNKQAVKINEAALFGGIQYELDNKQLAQVQSTTDTGNCTVFVSDSTQRSGSFGFLKGTGEEVTGIAEEFKQKGLTEQLFTGAVASEAAFKKLSGTKADIIHIATHGFYLPIEKTKREDFRFMTFDNDRRNVIVQNPLLRSGLAFAGANRAWRGDSIPGNWEDGILTSHEISQLNLTKTELVVLSACETALGDIKGSEGVFGLQRAFKMAGVQTLIMSLWKVPDAQTSQLMQGFYKYWLSGMTKHEAFKKAQGEIRALYPKDPYYWAAFVLID